MPPCRSCYIFGTWRSKDGVKGGGGLKSSYGEKLKGGSHKVKGGGASFFSFF